MWSKGRHFRIASRDASKTTADSYISGYFDVGSEEKQEFIGQIDQIMKLNYDTVKPVLIKAKWYKNNGSAHRASTKLVDDECGIQHVLTNEFMKDHLVRHEPFVWPCDCNQVFLVPDRLHPHWQLVVDTEVRKTRPTLSTPIHDIHASADTELGGDNDAGSEVAIVESESEGEVQYRNVDRNIGEDIYEEEILTYKRRAQGVQVPQGGNQNVDPFEMNAVLSDYENPPEMEDFPVVET